MFLREERPKIKGHDLVATAEVVNIGIVTVSMPAKEKDQCELTL